MSKCRNCKIEVLDHTAVCPLCRCVLEQSEKEPLERYPNVRIREKKIALIVRIYMFVAIAIEILLIFINRKQANGVWWSLIVAGVFVYIYLILRIGIQDDRGYRSKMILLTVFAMALLYLIDRVAGYQGWSLNYVLPSGVILLNLAIMVLMIVNWRNWPSYLLFQLFCILCSLFPIFLWKRGYITKPFLSEIALAISLMFFLGTVIIGGRKAKEELERRFHV
ncbi:MAG: zinc ribbon domain-containing protein [Lachnospiraceae bacterium]|nr:zinc ribbon domain-containing protein [Lachnospiraceae bacterium]